MPEIDCRVMIRHACRRLGGREAERDGATYAINLSGLSLSHEALADYVTRELHDSGADQGQGFALHEPEPF